MSKLIRLADFKRQQCGVFFSRRELNQLLALYSRHVMRGEWRDYAIDHRPGTAVFSVFRRSLDRPLFTIAKSVAGGTDRRAEFVVLCGRRKVRSGASLDEILGVLEMRLRVVS